MTESSGVFTFPSTGIYEITFNAQFSYSSQYARRYCVAYLDKVISGTSSILTQANSAIHGDSGESYSVSGAAAFFDVTDVSTHKVQFRTRAEGSTAVITGHSASRLKPFASFKKLGDT